MYNLLIMIARGLMRAFFYLLYHPFAWAYDLVAGVVSMGRWRDWVLTAVNMLPKGPVLELGFGPGHLLADLTRRGFNAVGIDASRQMARLARRNLRKQRPGAALPLVRARGQALPFPVRRFAAVVATFPAEYIAQEETLREARRVLRPNGRLVILLAVQITGNSLRERGLRLIYQLTGETPSEQQITDLAHRPFQRGGFEVEQVWIEQPGSRLLFLIGRPTEEQGQEKASEF